LCILCFSSCLLLLFFVCLCVLDSVCLCLSEKRHVGVRDAARSFVGVFTAFLLFFEESKFLFGASSCLSCSDKGTRYMEEKRER